MSGHELWIHEREWNCIPPASDFVVMRGYGPDAQDVAEFSTFDHGWDAKRLAEEHLASLATAVSGRDNEE